MRRGTIIMMQKRIAILGSTGSVGRSALRVIDSLNSLPGGRRYEVFALTAHKNVKLLAEQARRHRPQYVAVTDPCSRDGLREALRGLDVRILCGGESAVEIAGMERVDVVLAAIVGIAGLAAVLAAADAGKRLAIANKEPLVVAGQLLVEAAGRGGASILPVDSEHSAIFQAMRAGSAGEVRKIILTSSGGPFRDMSASDLSGVSIGEALSHPVWAMGPKITVDSATMMNKALEVIEAHWLFSMPVENIEVLIHPESIIHSLVEFVDGSVMAQLAEPDMCLPIQYALTHPDRLPGAGSFLRLEEIEKLTFKKPDPKLFRSLALGYEVARMGGTAPAVFNAANEAAVKEFLAGRIGFVNIVPLIEHCVTKHDFSADVSLPELLNADAWARKEIGECLKKNHS